MWTPNSVQVPADMVMRALHGEIAPEVLLAAAGFMLIQNSTVESLTKQYALTLRDAKHAQSLLQTGFSETDVRDESPSMEIEEEVRNPESDGDVRGTITQYFPEVEVTDKQVEQLGEYDLQRIDDAIFVIHHNSIEKGNVYEPMGLLFWTLKNRDADAVQRQRVAIENKPKSKSSILGEALERARQQAPPKPGPTPEMIEKMKARNEAARNVKKT